MACQAEGSVKRAKAWEKKRTLGGYVLSGPVLKLCHEAMWEVKTRELSQVLGPEGLDDQAEAMGLDPDGHS